MRVLMLVLMWCGHFCPQEVFRTMVLVRVMMTVLMLVVVVSFRGRGRPRHMILILLCPVLLARHVFFAIDPDVDLSRRNAAAHDPRDLKLRSQPECRHRVFQQSWRDSGVHQRAEK